MVILCHGTPGCGLISRAWSEACALAGAGHPAARPHLLDDEGHFSILERRLGDVVSDLREMGQLRVL
ncbi:MAG: hypothetical protein ACXVR1_10010 [Solirubrobacteraceae bacterium]